MSLTEPRAVPTAVPTGEPIAPPTGQCNTPLRYAICSKRKVTRITFVLLMLHQQTTYSKFAQFQGRSNALGYACVRLRVQKIAQFEVERSSKYGH